MSVSRSSRTRQLVLGAISIGLEASGLAYHRTADNNSYYPALPAPHGSHYLWSRRLDGQVYAQPLVVGSLLIIATEHNSVYTFSLATHLLI
jgi:hypothetical protein